ncbi:MAG: tetratricopeptide repeat protein [Rhodobacteraceae bacterium]|nr:tetratricopeptide repeat protein [Paracoccaceae bacterium]
MQEYLTIVQEWLIAEARWLIPGTGLVGATAIFVRFVVVPFQRASKVRLTPDSIAAIKPSDEAKLSVTEFIALRRDLKQDLEEELAEAADTEKALLNARIAALQAQIACPDEELAKARKRISDLEALLDRTSNEISAERVSEAKDRLKKGGYSAADGIFAEIEAQSELAVKAAARAAYGRGEVAEAEVRWSDAAAAYRRAAELDPSYHTLTKAHEFAHWSGDFTRARALGEDLVRVAGEEGNDANTAMAWNDFAMTMRAVGELDASEKAYRTALELDRGSIGEDHADYAVHLNNYARLKREQGALNESEALYREALRIGRAAKGEDHAQHANHLHNLGGILEAQGMDKEAEPYLREALEVDLRTIGARHPHYGLHLMNHAKVLGKLGRIDEARDGLQRAVDIFSAALPVDHPYRKGAYTALAALKEPA